MCFESQREALKLQLFLSQATVYPGNTKGHLQCSVNMAHQDDLALSSKVMSQAEPAGPGDSGLFLDFLYLSTWIQPL